MNKFEALREAELRVLMHQKAETILIMAQQQTVREHDNLIIAELAAEISAIAVEIERQNYRVN